MSWLRCVAMVALLLAVAAPALGAPSPAEKETARALVRKGMAKEKEGDLEAARDAYQAAHDIMGVPTTGLKLGQTQYDLGRWVEALDTLLAVTRLPKEGYEPRAFRRARAQAEKLAKELAPRIPSVQVELEGDAAEGAEVLLDGEPLREESIGVPYKVNPGEHVVEAINGSIKQEIRAEVEEAEKRVVVMKLQRPPEPPPVPVDEDDGTAAIALTAVGFGLAGAGVLVGSITGILSTEQASEIATSCPAGQCPPETHGDLDSATTLGHVSTAMFIVGAAGAIAGTVGLAWVLSRDDADDQEPGDADTALVLTPAGVALRGGF